MSSFDRPELRFFTVVRLHTDSEGRLRAKTPLMAEEEWEPFRESFSRVVLYARISSKSVSDDGYLVGAQADDVIPLPYYDGPIGFLFRSRAIGKFLASHIRDPAVVYGLWAPSSISAMVSKRVKTIGARLIVRLIGDPTSVATSIAPFGLRSILAKKARRATRNVVRSADAVVYVTLRTLQREYPAAADALTLARTNLRLASSTVEAAPKAYQQNSATSPVTLIAVGSQQQSYKGHDVLIAAVAELRARGRDVRLTLVGDGRVHDDLELQAERLGLDDVKFLRQVGTSDDVIAEVRRHDIFVMPSRTEGMPKALLEAMLAGVFSLGSNVGGFQKCWIPSVSSNPTRRPRWSKGWNTFWSARF
ncbi:glycosyltransferase [Microbacterium suwonense]|uniref:Glycosyl transferase family 1 domain-containing protein n=1 Tax=Microbacterium suwonense TaxID=683047 RepID=A0ABM8FUI6_9MICO|nr:hypothetical protein GCM10025863_18390 [Microbacterium suwonense]